MRMGKRLTRYLKKDIDITGRGLVHIGSGMSMGEIQDIADDCIVLDPSVLGKPITVPQYAWEHYNVVEKYSP